MSDLVTLMALLRGLHLATMVSLLGTTAFTVWMLPAVAEPPAALRRRLYRLCQVSGSVAILAGAAWFVLQTAAMADVGSWPALLDAFPLVALHTRYGTIMLARLLLVLVATVLGCLETKRGTYLTLVLSAVALGLEGLIGHAGATAGATGHELVISEALHLLAAGLWLGALLPLWLSVQALPPAQAAVLCERFTPVGLGRIQVVGATPFERKLRCRVESGGRIGRGGRPYSHLVARRLQDAMSGGGSGWRLRPVWPVRMPRSRQGCRRR